MSRACATTTTKLEKNILLLCALNFQWMFETFITINHQVWLVPHADNLPEFQRESDFPVATQLDRVRDTHYIMLNSLCFYWIWDSDCQRKRRWSQPLFKSTLSAASRNLVSLYCWKKETVSRESKLLDRKESYHVLQRPYPSKQIESDTKVAIRKRKMMPRGRKMGKLKCSDLADANVKWYDMLCLHMNGHRRLIQIVKDYNNPNAHQLRIGQTNHDMSI